MELYVQFNDDNNGSRAAKRQKMFTNCLTVFVLVNLLVDQIAAFKDVKMKVKLQKVKIKVGVNCTFTNLL